METSHQPMFNPSAKCLTENSATTFRNKIIESTKGKPSIVFINNDKMPLSITVGDLEKDSCIYSLNLEKHAQIMLCPYVFPKYLSERQIQDGAIVKLGLITKRYHYVHLPINGNPTANIIKSRGIDFYDYIKNKNKLYTILNIEPIKNGLMFNLNLMTQERHYFNLPIGGNSTVKFGDTIRVDYNVKNNTIYIVHDDNILQSLPITDQSINPDLTRTASKRRLTY
jgi:hypothetical protein